jgi:predicted PurR-regulated permease PerM
MTPTIPVSVWEQIAVVIVFAFLLAGLGWILVKVFTRAIADINAHYAQVLKETNTQWQQYFDARSDASKIISEQMMERMDQIATVLGDLVKNFDEHDRMERQALESMAEKRVKLTSRKS